MATINKFEEINAWQKARELDRLIFSLCQKDKLSTDFPLKNQILKASGSVMDNIAEGFERSSRLEFVQFLTVSKGSVGEVRSQLYRAFDRKYITEEEFDQVSKIAEEIGKMLMGLIEYLNKADIRGKKFENRI